jgi:3-hydroxyacyl-CoA dehydrogenase
MKRTIKKSCSDRIGIMGSGIAILPTLELKFYFWTLFQENLLMPKQKGLTLESKIVRNRLVNEHLNSLKSKPSLFTVNLRTALKLEILPMTWTKLPV